MQEWADRTEASADLIGGSRARLTLQIVLIRQGGQASVLLHQAVSRCWLPLEGRITFEQSNFLLRMTGLGQGPSCESPASVLKGIWTIYHSSHYNKRTYYIFLIICPSVCKHLKSHFQGILPFKVLFGGKETPNKSVSTFLWHGVMWPQFQLKIINMGGIWCVCVLIETLCFGPIWC